VRQLLSQLVRQLLSQLLLVEHRASVFAVSWCENVLNDLCSCSMANCRLSVINLIRFIWFTVLTEVLNCVGYMTYNLLNFLWLLYGGFLRVRSELKFDCF
jgi:hypothetical protein